MIEVLIKCPFEVWQIDDVDCEDREVEVKETDCDLIEGCLNSNYGFLDDLNEYAEKNQLKTEFILPSPQVKLDELGKPYIEIKAYSAEAVLKDRDLGKIAEYVRGQVSDGWGENGFDLWGDRHLEFDWENVVHRGCRVIPNEEFQETILYPFQRLRASAFERTYPDYDPEHEAESLADLLKDLTETLGQLEKELNALADKKDIEKEILEQVEQLKTSVKAGLND